MTEETIKSNVDVEANNPTQHQEVKPVQKHELANVQSINGGINTINFFDEKQLAAAENFLTKVMRSEKGGIKSVNDGLAVLMRAQDLGLPLVLVLSIFMLLMVKQVLMFILSKHYFQRQELLGIVQKIILLCMNIQMDLMLILTIIFLIMLNDVLIILMRKRNKKLIKMMT